MNILKREREGREGEREGGGEMERDRERQRETEREVVIQLIALFNPLRNSGFSFMITQEKLRVAARLQTAFAHRIAIDGYPREISIKFVKATMGFSALPLRFATDWGLSDLDARQVVDALHVHSINSHPKD